jgi:hypothetical protein
MTVTLTAFEVDPDDSAWDENNAQDAPPAAIPNGDTLAEMEVPVLTVTPITLYGASSELPAIKVQWAEPEDPRIRQIAIEAVPEAGGTPTAVQVDWATGEVVLTRAAAVEADPVIVQFLDFLARDIGAHPERLQRIDLGLVKRGRELAADVKFDMDAPLSPEDE